MLITAGLPCPVAPAGQSGQLFYSTNSSIWEIQKLLLHWHKSYLNLVIFSRSKIWESCNCPSPQAIRPKSKDNVWYPDCYLRKSRGHILFTTIFFRNQSELLIQDFECEIFCSVLWGCRHCFSGCDRNSAMSTLPRTLHSSAQWVCAESAQHTRFWMRSSDFMAWDPHLLNL